jgi:hypothetical protein
MARRVQAKRYRVFARRTAQLYFETEFEQLAAIFRMPGFIVLDMTRALRLPKR